MISIKATVNGDDNELDPQNVLNAEKRKAITITPDTKKYPSLTTKKKLFADINVFRSNCKGSMEKLAKNYDVNHYYQIV